METIVERMGLVCVNPDVELKVEGLTLAETIGVLGMATETMRRAVNALSGSRFDDQSQVLDDVRDMLFAQSRMTEVAVAGLVTICHQQGLKFAERVSKGDAH